MEFEQKRKGQQKNAFLSLRDGEMNVKLGSLPGKYRPAWRMTQTGARSVFSPRAALRIRSFLRGGKALFVKGETAWHGAEKGSWVGKPCVKENSAGASNKLDQLISIVFCLVWMNKWVSMKGSCSFLSRWEE